MKKIVIYQSETSLYDKIRLALSKFNSRMFRNNVGLFKTIDGRSVKTGLFKGSSDLIGWTTKKVTQDMVGKNVAIFTAIEVKSKGKIPKEHQLNFINQVNKSGGISFIAFSEIDAEQKLLSKI